MRRIGNILIWALMAVVVIGQSLRIWYGMARGWDAQWWLWMMTVLYLKGRADGMAKKKKKRCLDCWACDFCETVVNPPCQTRQTPPKKEQGT